MGAKSSQEGDFATAAAVIEDVQVGLLTSLDHQGRFHTRPVQTLRVEPARTLWFFTDWSSPKVGELQRDARVSVGYADPRSNRFVAVSGSASLMRDPEKAKELWRVEQFAYYLDGPGDVRLAVLRVQVEQAEYWLGPERSAYLMAAGRARVTGKAAAVIGENRKVD